MSLYSTNMSVPICLGAAQENVVLIHHIIAEDPSNRRWKYYCYYCLSATLILLMRIFECPQEEAGEYIRICSKSIEVFESINSGQSRKCAALVKNVLQRHREPARSQRERPRDRSLFTTPDDVRSSLEKGLATTMEAASSTQGGSNIPADFYIGDIFGDPYKDQTISEVLNLSSEMAGDEQFLQDSYNQYVF